MATLAQLQNRVQSTLGLKSSGNELTLLTDYLNEAYVDILVRTRCHTNCGDLSTIAATWKYRLPTAILSVLEMWSEDSTNGTPPEFVQVTSQELTRMRRSAASTSSTSSASTYYAVEGHDMLMLWPTPQAVGSIEYLYVPRPTAMSGASDTPSYIQAEWHRALETYACWRMADYDDDGSSQVGEVYRQQYEGQDGRGGLLRQIRQQNRWGGGRRVAPMRVRRRSGGMVASSRSYDS